MLDLFGGFDDGDRIRRFAHRPDRLIVLAMADEENLISLLGKSEDLEMDFGHQRAGCVDLDQAPAL